MIQSKDCKELLYNMLNDNILSITELSKTNDHQPSRTFYLFTIDMYHLCKKILGYSYKVSRNWMIKLKTAITRYFKTFYNLMVRNDMEIDENKRLIEKQQKLDSIIETLKLQGLIF